MAAQSNMDMPSRFQSQGATYKHHLPVHSQDSFGTPAQNVEKSPQQLTDELKGSLSENALPDTI